ARRPVASAVEPCLIQREPVTAGAAIGPGDDHLACPRPSNWTPPHTRIDTRPCIRGAQCPLRAATDAAARVRRDVARINARDWRGARNAGNAERLCRRGNAQPSSLRGARPQRFRGAGARREIPPARPRLATSTVRIFACLPTALYIGPTLYA